MNDPASALLTIIAGPNGSGKSTIAVAFGFGTDSPVPFINADIIASEISPVNPAHAAVAAGKIALLRQQYYLERGKSFAVETTLAGRNPLRTLRRGHQHKFVIHLVYVAVEAVQTNLDRIAGRVARGGHHIPDSDVRRRYHRSLANLAQAVVLADRATIIDNSGEAPREVLLFEHGDIVGQAADMPAWVTQALSVLLMQDDRPGEEVQDPPRI